VAPSGTVLAFPGGCPGNGVADARVAEWQTRWLQVPVSARTWGFKSPLAHHTDRQRTPGDLTGGFVVSGEVAGTVNTGEL
jgi:hypothetical protein